ASRTVPALRLQRLKLRQEVTTIDDVDLRFTTEETAGLIVLIAGKFISVDDVQVLIQRNEGWAAGLHLAAMALGDEDDPSQFIHEFSGGSAPVAEFLEHEMLLRQPPDVVKFLLQTSLLDRLSADLTQAVSDRPDAMALLDTLAKSNMFVVPVNLEEGE